MSRGRRGGRGRRRGAVSAHRPVSEFARRLGYRFRNIGRLEEALTHGSYRNDHEVADYERLEFLGDAALGLVVTEVMHHQRPDWSGRRRQETKSELVSNQSLAAAARTLGLEDGIRVGRGRAAGEAVRSSDRILANVFEAVLGAAYLDGGVPGARGIVGTAFRARLRQLGLDPPRGPSERRARSAVRRLSRSTGRLAVRLVRRLLFLRSRQERALGITFADPSLVQAALDREHEPTASSERSRRGGRRRSRGAGGNRRLRGGVRGGRNRNPGRHALRFLGRDVMHLVTADALQDAFPEWDEGRLTLARMRLQERAFTTRLSVHWGLGDDERAASDAEALMGALYLDGRLKAARRALGRPFREALEDLGDPDLELLDPKTALQNRLAREGREAPRYEMRHQTGAANRSGELSVTVRLEGGIVETGRGRGLKEAEKTAAAQALARLDRAEEKRRSPRRSPPRSPVEPDEADRRPAPGTDSNAAPPGGNPKGELQEALVKQQGRLPVYRLISESGPEHDKTFVVEVLVGRQPLGRGSGRSKRVAEARAAAEALSAI